MRHPPDFSPENIKVSPGLPRRKAEKIHLQSISNGVCNSHTRFPVSPVAVNNLPVSKMNTDFLLEITRLIFTLRRHAVVCISSRISIVREEEELPRITEEFGLHGLRQFRTYDYVYIYVYMYDIGLHLALKHQCMQ
jgi:hypothetical protein